MIFDDKEDPGIACLRKTQAACIRKWRKMTSPAFARKFWKIAKAKLNAPSAFEKLFYH